MGHRANFVVVHDGRAELYYSRWAATTLTQTLFFGPEFAFRYIEGLEPTEVLLDDVWCEGAALVDQDARRLLFFVSHIHYHPGLRRHFLPMLGINWPGWEIAWADQGIIDVALRLGIDPSLVRDESAGDFLFEKAGLGAAPEFRESLITVGRSGDARDYGFEETSTQVLAWGPALIDHLQDRVQAPLVEDEDLCNGAFLDPDRKEMWVWWSTTEDDRYVDRIAASWPGWAVRRHNEGLRKHVELSGRDASHISMGQDEAIRRIVELLSEGRDFDPKEMLDAVLKGREEADIQIGHGFFRADKPEIDAASKAEILVRTIAAYRMDAGGQGSRPGTQGRPGS